MSKSKLSDIQYNWEGFAHDDPMWAILTRPNKRYKGWEHDDFFATGKKQIHHLFGELKAKKISFNTVRAMDFGCGMGRLSRALADRFENTVGVDISSKMVELATSANQSIKGLTFVQNSQIPFEQFNDETFDFVLSYITLQHNDPEISTQYLSEFCRILSTDGLLVFQLPSEPDNSWVGMLIRLPRPILNTLRWFRQLLFGQGRYLMEMHGVRKERVIRLLEEGGMTVLDVTECSFAGKGWRDYKYIAKKK